MKQPVRVTPEELSALLGPLPQWLGAAPQADNAKDETAAPGDLAAPQRHAVRSIWLSPELASRLLH